MKKTAITEIRIKAIKILNKNLGAEDTLRFIQDLSSGYGDYTKERHDWLDEYSIDDIYDEIKK